MSFERMSALERGRFRIGLETRPVVGRRTGIGNYSFHLLKALMEQYRDLAFVGYRNFSWAAVDQDFLHAIEMGQAGGPHARPWSRIAAGLRRELRNSAAARWIDHTGRRLAFERSVKHQSLDLFHVFNCIPLADPGVPFLPVVYDLSFLRYPDAHPKERVRWLLRLEQVVARAPFVQTISEFSRSEIIAQYNYPAERIFVAPPAAADIFVPRGEAATASDLATFDLRRGGYLLAVGTLEPRKNLKMLVAAYETMPPARRARAPLVIAGGAGWGDLDLPKGAAALIANGSIRLVGGVSDAQLRSLYEGAIALAFPSVYEGFGMPVVEAMSCGTRVIHSEDTSMDEVSAGLAIRLPAGDVDGWSSALAQVIEEAEVDDPDRRAKLIAQARTFDWKRSAAKVRASYEALTA